MENSEPKINTKFEEVISERDKGLEDHYSRRHSPFLPVTLGICALILITAPFIKAYFNLG